jgi:hypothetical protein
MPSTTLTVDGTTYNAAALAANRIKLDRLARELAEFDELAFHQFGLSLPPLFKEGQAVTLSADGTPVFKGEISDTQQAESGEGWAFAYTAKGLKYLGSKVAVTNAVDFTGEIVYNLPPGDEDYIQANAGLSVGTILQKVFDAHASALAAYGIAGYVSGDLTPLTLVPVRPVLFNGRNLFAAVDSFLEQWAGNCVCAVRWNAGTSDWRVRILDTTDSTAFVPTTLTLDSDPVEPPEVRRDANGVFSRVVVRGFSDVQPAYASLGDGTLLKGWTAADETAWTMDDFTHPKGGADDGAISAVTSTSATISSDDAAKVWGTNYWGTNEGVIYLINPTSTTITQQEWRIVTANGSLSAGGSCTISWDSSQPLVNGGYTRYHLAGSPPGRSNTYRLYSVVGQAGDPPNTPGPTNPNPSYVAQHMVRRFPRPVVFSPSDALATQTQYPRAAIGWSSGHVKPYVLWNANFEILPSTAQIRFYEPVVKAFGTPSNLTLGGTHVDGKPDDLIVLLAYARGVLSAPAPADVAGVAQYAGTGFSFLGLQRTWYVDVPSWNYFGDTTNMAALAAMLLKTVQDVVYEGSVVYHGLYETALTGEIALSFAGSGFTTGWEAINSPVRSAVVEWPDAGSADDWLTTLRFSNRRKPQTGEDYYIHPAFAGGAAWEGGGSGGSSPFAQFLTADLMGNHWEASQGPQGLDFSPAAPGSAGDMGIYDDAPQGGDFGAGAAGGMTSGAGNSEGFGIGDSQGNAGGFDAGNGFNGDSGGNGFGVDFTPPPRRSPGGSKSLAPKAEFTGWGPATTDPIPAPPPSPEMERASGVLRGIQADDAPAKPTEHIPAAPDSPGMAAAKETLAGVQAGRDGGVSPEGQRAGEMLERSKAPPPDTPEGAAAKARLAAVQKKREESEVWGPKPKGADGDE